MKNLINYYYNLVITEYKKTKNKFIFTIDKYEYEFILFDGNPSKLSKIYGIINNSRNYCHEIVLNKDNTIFTNFNNNLYVLIKKNCRINKYVDLNEIFYYVLKTDMHGLLNWKKLWENKIDYYEYQMSQIFFKYPKLKESFNYYAGMAETAISLLNYVEGKQINYYISHYRIEYKELIQDFFNPINLTLDYWIRDISEYIKINYINESISLPEVLTIINNLNLNRFDSLLFLARLIYPSYYFDMYDQIIQNKISQDKIEIYTKKNTIYEVFLKKVYSVINSKKIIPEIEWLT